VTYQSLADTSLWEAILYRTIPVALTAYDHGLARNVLFSKNVIILHDEVGQRGDAFMPSSVAALKKA